MNPTTKITSIEAATSNKKRKSLAKDTVGAVMAEYMIILGLVVFVAVAGFTLLGTNASGVASTQAGSLSGIPSSF